MLGAVPTRSWQERAAGPTDIEIDTAYTAPAFSDEHIVGQETEEPADRLERWKRRLLNLDFSKQASEFQGRQQKCSARVSWEPERLYAFAVRAPPGTPSATRTACQIADPAGSGFTPDSELFHDPLHRGRVRTMVSHVIEIEGPIYENPWVQRIARAHGFSRSAGRIREVVLDAIDTQHPKTIDNGRALVWPRDADVSIAVAVRAATGDIRDHSDVP